MRLNTKWMGGVIALLSIMGGQAQANQLKASILRANCHDFTVEFKISVVQNYVGTVGYTLYTSPLQPGTPLSRSLAVAGSTTSASERTFTETVNWPVPLTGVVSITGTAALDPASTVYYGTVFNETFPGSKTGVPLVVDCPLPPPVPAIKVEHEISIDGGLTYQDADTIGDAPSVIAPHGAMYRLVLTNTGEENLKQVQITDAAMGIVNVTVGDIPKAGQLIVTAAEIPELSQNPRCNAAGTFVNDGIATAVGEISGNAVTGTDPTHLVCENAPPPPPVPRITLEHEISVDGGTTFVDADTLAEAPVETAPHAAEYRLIVRNVGEETLTEVLVSDSVLGVNNISIADLAVGEEVIVNKVNIPALDQPARCTTAATFENKGVVFAKGLISTVQVFAKDHTFFVCNDLPPPPPVPKISLEHEISINGGVSYLDADTLLSAPIQVAPHDAQYRLIVKNLGEEVLKNVVISDASMGVVNLPIADLPLGGEIIITAEQVANLAASPRCSVAGTFINTGEVAAVGVISGQPVAANDPTHLVCEQVIVPPPIGQQGCTPGYWKQPQHLDSWTGYEATADYATTFGVSSSFTKTLLEALGQGGGNQIALGRHAVAALLNAASYGVAYPVTADQIIALVQSAYATGQFEAAKNKLAAYNELGCPLN